ncbi:orotidine-5'-phosphate decarboxylase [Candidatus Parcubacteria bacterium]|nr:orotidine-5'-phosphate decarboxylase [Patescibacteria group bacterium]MBU4309877.1 orotidine-5'-phosphate decarboxylase [Patescibacteria group bacterium]MBU4431712.1 orotidine-5'-phosphate decarboxylase [Patescibacteria group bacterium]MBU4578216.1 orotidine-5'-phosphate decarboxylase [Patescibacteria group bacterium]MCG2696752.1 orotidine-5'-phosphate decarboxylase [Candidatus Parcubacteria bacterium]
MSKIIVALDGMDTEDALVLAKNLEGTGVILKANDLLDGGLGVTILEVLSRHAEVMDDAKFHDIPNTVKNRVKKHIFYKPSLITVHASGGVAMMRAAVEAAGDSKILAVTVLTSLNEEECNINYGMPVKAKVLQFARNAVLAGVYGIVCSPMELKFLSQFPELNKLKKVTPGIRPKWHLDPNDDQSRITTPYDAVKMGADYLVIGRPITMATNPVEAVLETQKEINLAIVEK